MRGGERREDGIERQKAAEAESLFSVRVARARKTRSRYGALFGSEVTRMCAKLCLGSYTLGEARTRHLFAPAMATIAPEPSTSRGEITLQPNYFSSSLFVNPLREDFSTLAAAFSEQFREDVRPFELFKKLWVEQGWSWLHLRVHDGRARQAFLRITERVFAEHLSHSKTPLARVVALFSLYTFHYTQPSSSAPPVYSTSHIAIPTGKSLPGHVIYNLFHILPHSETNAQYPSRLPREVFVMDGQEASATLQASTGDVAVGQTGAPKKKGRPSKRDKIRKAKEALASLERYVDRNYVALPEPTALLRMEPPPTLDGEPIHTAHTLFAQAPTGSLENYLARKHELLAAVHSDAPGGSQDAALRRANEAVLARLKQIDEMAAEKGLEVGGEGGDKTGLIRVEKAVEELRQSVGVGASGGILGLLEGAGMDGTSSR
ncbi:hypothetical protein PYCCODRAFT_1477061 [Trametes coccinea BRFM310]|uniref:Uncharacterized protein n=1 Tax=Trametes coccinea (strain BRFM310) TaxID=1353009 RepID=A0A1Y2ISJ5_TRAC3|nr:hypothetical protein PYCCODRAFT_1477061 [Trametes coccinea BRFM310]